jgi:CheY-like chemotaxis protein
MPPRAKSPTTILPTTVFVVDDDQTVLRRVEKESLRSTNLGVLTASDLPTAAEFLERYPVGAVLADLNFRTDTRDIKRNVHDGLEFLNYVHKKHPNLPVYVFSMDVSLGGHQQRAKQMGVPVRDWYDKYNANTSQYSPWVRIERDLILNALKREPGMREKASKLGENPAELLTDEHVAEKVRQALSYPRLTYLQHLPDDARFRLKEPLEVHCWPEGDECVAKAIRLPLLTEARGEDPVEALDRLAELIIGEKTALDEEQDRLVGYAKFIREQLEAYLEPKA